MKKININARLTAVMTNGVPDALASITIRRPEAAIASELRRKKT